MHQAVDRAVQNTKGRVVRARRGVHLADLAEVRQCVVQHVVPRFVYFGWVGDAVNDVLVLQSGVKGRIEGRNGVKTSLMSECRRRKVP